MIRSQKEEPSEPVWDMKLLTAISMLCPPAAASRDPFSDSGDNPAVTRSVLISEITCASKPGLRPGLQLTTVGGGTGVYEPVGVGETGRPGLVAVGVGVKETTGVAVFVRLAIVVAVEIAVGEGVVVRVAVSAKATVEVGVTVREAVPVTMAVKVVEAVDVGVIEAVSLGVGESIVPVTEAEREGVRLKVEVNVAVRVGVAVRVRVRVGVELGSVPVAVRVTVAVGLEVSVSVGVGEGVMDAEAVIEEVAVAVDEAAGVGSVGETLGRGTYAPE